MIVDTSALVAILRDEPEAEAFESPVKGAIGHGIGADPQLRTKIARRISLHLAFAEFPVI
jgi:uncharacterized protein with PIN domain